jgi:hypothetical protein
MNTPDEKILIEKRSPYHYTQEGLELEERAEAALVPLFAEYLDRGYSPYDITSVLYEAVADTSREIVSTHRAEGKEAAAKKLQDKLESLK